MATQTQNLPAKVDTIRQLFERPAIKGQLQAALPKHLSVDRLLRVAMTAIRTNPKLADCTQKSLLACIMGCAALGLEPEPFLGQAYLVPFKRGETLECTLIPGYRGYITLARRSGEVQSVSAQVVYERDHFALQYGLNETLDHTPADGDRGEPKGAYVIFRYKDGSYSFDYMPTDDINKIRERSTAYQSGVKYKKYDSPWFTDWPEMAKKTVIRRHVKLAPLSVEMATAAALEEKANLGEDQIDLLTGEVNPAIEGEETDSKPEKPDFTYMVRDHLQGDTHKEAALLIFLTKTADYQKVDVETVKTKATENPENFWKSFWAWYAKQGQPKQTEPKQPPKQTTKKASPPPDEGGVPFPSDPITVDDRPATTRIKCPEYKETDLVFCQKECQKSFECEEWRA